MRTKHWILLIFTCILLFFPVQTVSASSYEVLICDDADLLTDQEENALYQDMLEVAEYGNVVFVSTDYNPYSQHEFAKSFYYDRFGEESGSLFLVDMDNRQITLFNDGAIEKTVTKSYSNTITDNVYTYASSGDYYGCAKEAFSEVYQLMNGRKIAQPMKYISNLLFAILLAFLLNYVVLKITASNRKASLNDLTQATNNSVRIIQPRALRTHTTRKYSPQSSGSSGGSGGGGGGSSSGSSGSHSF